MKASYYVDTENKDDTELLLKQAIILHRSNEPSQKTLESKVKKILDEYFKRGEK